MIWWAGTRGEVFLYGKGFSSRACPALPGVDRRIAVRFFFMVRVSRRELVPPYQRAAMNILHRPILRGLLAVLAAAAPAESPRAAAAFLPPPHFGYVYPAGGQQGTSVDVTVGGQFLRGVSDVHVWGERSASRRGQIPQALERPGVLPPAREDARNCADRWQAQRASAGFGGGRAMYAKILTRAGPHRRRGGQTSANSARNAVNPKRQLNVQIAETVVLQVKLAADATPGPRELRLISASAGFPIRWRSTWAACRRSAKASPAARPPKPRSSDSLPVVLNGQILPGGGADRFAFQARKGTQLVAVASARDLIPYLADAVPGWFQATLTLYDPAGNEVAYADDYRFQPDPVLYYEMPADGRYVLEIKDALYRGRQDFVYRIVLGELPFVTGIFPLGGRGRFRSTSTCRAGTCRRSS